jgi:hypothetical protein
LRKAALLTFAGVDAFGIVCAVAMPPTTKDNTKNHEKRTAEIRIVVSILDIRRWPLHRRWRQEKQRGR